MSDLKFTPGPWTKADGAKGYLGQKESEMTKTFFIKTSFEEITNGPQAEVAEVKHGSRAAQMGNSDFGHTISIEEAEANAKLIAAAPELLQLVQWITRVTNNPEIGIKCDAAIKKATT